MTAHLGLIGGGNMAYAIVSGLIASGYPANHIHVSDPSETSRDRLSGLGVHTTDKNQDIVARASVIIFAVKPQVFRAVGEPLAGQFSQQHTVLSICAGIPIKRIREVLQLSEEQRVVRVMPNTPCLIGEGMSCLTSDRPVAEAEKASLAALFTSCGQALWVADEEAIDAVTAVSGSGPAYFFLLMESMMRSAARLGLPESVARQLVLQTAVGSALMARQASDPPAVLRAQVTSPGGTTQAALEVFEEGDFPGLVDQALIAARDRAFALAQD
ncbi:MAG: pyrroline-5-carboxylate reductase [Gammaproteobacteria bacterium]|nr:pyrroline-5-carboxylate reductase [Gammaproteobacteria bacterium]